MFTFVTFALWVISIIMLVIEINMPWLAIFIITLVYLIIRGVIWLGFDIGDLFD